MKNLIVISFLVLLAACKKEKTIHITAINPVTNAPYPGLQYFVVQEVTGFNGEKFETVVSGTLDANGEVFINKRLRKNASYLIRVVEPDGSCYNKNINLSFGGEEKHFECPFEFAPCAYMKFKIANQNCEGPNDKLSYEDRFNYTDWRIGTNGIFGCFQNESNGYDAVPAGLRIYRWRVERSTGTTEYIDSIYLNAGDSGIFEMYY
jgi:hypothetical protein